MVGSTALIIDVVDGCGLFSRALTDLVIVLLSTIVLTVTGYACQLQFFLNTNVLLIFGEWSNTNLHALSTMLFNSLCMCMQFLYFLQ